MEEQNNTIAPIDVEANALLDQIPFLKLDTTAPEDQNNAKRALMRGIFKPFAYFLLENSDARNSLSKMQTPEEIIAAVATHPNVSLENEKQRELLSEFGPGEHRDWKTIGL